MSDEWSRRTRQSKLASVMYPNLASQTTRNDMSKLAKNEAKRAPAASPLLDHHTRGSLSPLGGRMK
jgi:hypothetical protein